MSEPASKLTYLWVIKDGKRVRPSEVECGDIFTCLDPERRHLMIVREGKRMRRHFAHKSGQVGSCSGESALHNETKLAIKERFEKAKEEHDLFLAIWPCQNCGDPDGNIHDLAQWADKVALEREIRYGQKRIKPDLVFMNDAGKPLFTIEVVLTHWPEEQTLDVIDEMRLKVFYFRPTWDWLEDFLRADLKEYTAPVEVDALSRWVRSNNECPNRSCKEKVTARQMVNEAMKIKRRFTRWTTTGDVLNQAQVLAKLGFIQDDEHLSLFVLYLNGKPFVETLYSTSLPVPTRDEDTWLHQAISDYIKDSPNNYDEQKKVWEQDWVVYADFSDHFPVNIYSKSEYWNRSTESRLKYQGELWHRIENTILDQVYLKLNDSIVKFKRLYTQPWGWILLEGQMVPIGTLRIGPGKVVRTGGSFSRTFGSW
jgi:hypothetical protein